MSPSPNLSKKAKFALVVAGAGFLFACGFAYVKVIKPPKIVNLSEYTNRNEAKELDPDPVHLSTKATSESGRVHILDGDFAIAYRMQDIPQNCMSGLYTLPFVHDGGTSPNKEEIRFSDTGQSIQIGDSMAVDVPFRRLFLAGLGSKSCFIFYQHWGIDRPLSCLAVVGYADGKTVWVGATGRKTRYLRQLRSLLAGNRFEDSLGPVC